MLKPGHYVIQDLMDRGLLYVGDGYRAKNDQLGKTGLPFARAGNIDGGFQFADADHLLPSETSKAGQKISRPGDVVFTSKGTVGRFAFVTEDVPQFVYSPQLCFWRSLDHRVLEPQFLYFWMLSSEFRNQYVAVKGQTDMADYVSLQDQRRMKLFVPAFDAQEKIIGTLGVIERKIHNSRRAISLLEKARDHLLPKLISTSTSPQEETGDYFAEETP